MPAPSLFPMLIAAQAQNVVGFVDELFQYGNVSKHVLEVFLGDGMSVMQQAFGMALADAIAEKAVDTLKTGRTLEAVGSLIAEGTQDFTASLLAYSLHAFKAQIAANANDPCIALLCDHGQLSANSKQAFMAQAHKVLAKDVTPPDRFASMANSLSNNDVVQSNGIDAKRKAMTNFVQTFGDKKPLTIEALLNHPLGPESKLPLPNVPSLGVMVSKVSSTETSRTPSDGIPLAYQTRSANLEALYGPTPISEAFEQAKANLLLAVQDAPIVIKGWDEQQQERMSDLGKWLVKNVIDHHLSRDETVHLMDNVLNTMPGYLAKGDNFPLRLKQCIAVGFYDAVKGQPSLTQSKISPSVTEMQIHLLNFNDESLAARAAAVSTTVRLRRPRVAAPSVVHLRRPR